MLILLIALALVTLLVRCNYAVGSLWHQERARADHRTWQKRQASAARRSA